MSEELEWKTRRERVNKKLQSLSIPWNIIKYREGLDVAQLSCHAVEEYPTGNGPADYALFVNGKLLGIIEAKKVGVGAQNVLEQAKRYSRGVFASAGNWQGYRVPFLFSTNGENIYFLDVRNENNISRKISNFHTADALEEFFNRDINSEDWFKNNPVEIIRLRDYQKRCIEETESAIINKKREMLIAMATGTGKTFTTVAQIYRILESKTAKRILFLVDRKALAAQAVRTFFSFDTLRGNKFDQEYEVYSQRFQKEDFDEDQPFNPKILPQSYLASPNSSHTFVYVSTIQRMAINLYGRESVFSEGERAAEIDEDAQKLDIPIHAFDLIIADECHRGYTAKETSVWRSVLEYFDAVKIGLTATPASHTLGLFKEVVYRYTTEEAINDGWLVDYDVVNIRSDVRMNGVFLKEGEEVGIVDTQTGSVKYDQLEDEREFSTADIEEKITAPDSNRKIVKEIAQYAYKHEENTGRFPKILIFAANDLSHTSHADQIVQICREEFGRGDDFVQKITGSPNVDRSLQKIRAFRNRPKPSIVVTVDMLTTGVDIPAIEFLVFLRPVKSRILWVQMLGRGTRLCTEINKENFTIFDCFGGSLIEYFKNTTDFTIEPLQKDVVSIEEVIEKIYQNTDRDYNVKVLVKRLRRIDRNMSAEAREKFAQYIPDGDIGKFAGKLPEMLKKDFAGARSILRDKNFKKLLVNYPRAKKDFVIGYEVVDEVKSEVMFNDGSKYQKPEDYLESFARFVKENPEHIDAIQILLKKPKEWKTEALNELRQKLNRSSFPEKELQKAHKLVYNKSLADIISMVKHAALKEEPIYTAEERVNMVIQKITQGKSFNNEQLEWLGFIKAHLVNNLTIEMADFERSPIFERAGGLGKIKKVFGGGLEPMIQEINYAIAS